MSFTLNPDLDRPKDSLDYSVSLLAGNSAAAQWHHAPDASAFDDGAAFRLIRAAVTEQQNDPQRLRRTAGEVAALLPAERSTEALASLWGLFISLAQQTPSTPYVSDDVPSTLARWINLNAFAALLWSYNLVDGRDHAVQQLRSAFEDRRSSDVGDRAAADARVVAAAQWAVHACQRLYHLSVTSSGEETTGAKAKRWRPGARFKGRAGFSFQRWEFWQAAFEEVHEFGSGGVEAKIEAGAASGMMEKVLYAGFEG
ncbi:hypothetical protein K4K56_012857 [Colletotrichum sp. SAR 10_98]|nr:hypothetical protein K4K56_012857 [Colletotrichum sp. SAR 10_98]